MRYLSPDQVCSIGDALLYGVVDLDYHLSAETAVVAAERLLEGGVDLLQLRANRLPKSVFAGLAQEIHAMTSLLEVPFILEGYPDLLAELPAEGVHLAAGEVSIDQARVMAGRPVLVGLDTHSLAEALTAAERGADYIGYGPLFENPPKSNRPVVGLDDVESINQTLSIPVFCRGGLTLENLPQARAAGVHRILMVSAWLEADDIAEAVQDARRLLTEE